MSTGIHHGGDGKGQGVDKMLMESIRELTEWTYFFVCLFTCVCFIFLFYIFVFPSHLTLLTTFIRPGVHPSGLLGEQGPTWESVCLKCAVPDWDIYGNVHATPSNCLEALKARATVRPRKGGCTAVSLAAGENALVIGCRAAEDPTQMCGLLERLCFLT